MLAPPGRGRGGGDAQPLQAFVDWLSRDFTILTPSCHSSPPCPPWAPQAQLRATLEVTQKQATKAESQLRELQQRSIQVQVQGLSAPPHPVLQLRPSGSCQLVPGCELP